MLDHSSRYSDKHLAKIILKACWKHEFFTSSGQICDTKEFDGDITLFHGCPPHHRGKTSRTNEQASGSTMGFRIIFKTSPTVWHIDQNYLC